MGKKFVPVQKNINEMTNDDIKAWLAGQPDSIIGIRRNH